MKIYLAPAGILFQFGISPTNKICDHDLFIFQTFIAMKISITLKSSFRDETIFKIHGNAVIRTQSYD